MYAPAPVPTKGEFVDAAIAELVLLGALSWAAQHRPGPNGWHEGDWRRVLGCLDPRAAVVVILYAIRGRTFEEIGDWLGVSRGTTHVLWKRAIGTLREHTDLDEVT